MTGGSSGLLDQRLGQLRDDTSSLAKMVDQTIDKAIEALAAQDSEAAQEVMAGDDKVNALRYGIKELCLELATTQQPAACDLRAIIAVIHVAVEVERMGDYAAGIAELAVRLASEPLLKPLIDRPRMAEIGRDMIHAGLRANVDEDAELAMETAKRDAEIDRRYDQTYREILTYTLEDPKSIDRA
ncbi:MAG: phosphate transport system regulatory protein PhoU, partial [Anaerolineales bacterium]